MHRKTIIYSVAAGIIAFASARLIFKPVTIIGSSMEPTLWENDWCLCFRIGKPSRKSIYVFDSLEGTRLAKRLVGMPGETVSVDSKGVYIDGRRLRETTLHRRPTNGDDKFTLGSGEYFLLGDNRLDSYDSRIFGPVRADRLKWRIIASARRH